MTPHLSETDDFWVLHIEAPLEEVSEEAELDDGRFGLNNPEDPIGKAASLIKEAAMDPSGIQDSIHRGEILVGTGVRIAFRKADPNWSRVRNNVINKRIAEDFSKGKPISRFRPKAGDSGSELGEIRQIGSARYIAIVRESGIVRIIAVKGTPPSLGAPPYDAHRGQGGGQQPAHEIAKPIDFGTAGVQKALSSQFFYQHSLEQLGRQLKIASNQAAGLVEYVSAVGCIDTKSAIKIVQSADSPSARKIMKILKLNPAAEESPPEQVDEAHIKQHDYRPNTTHTQLTDPATAGYSLFSVPASMPINAGRSINNITSMRCMTAPQLSKKAVTINSIDISPEEQEQAAKTRKEFEELLVRMNKAFEHLNTLNGALSDISDASLLEPLRKLFKQYKRKIQKLFNDFIEQLETSLLEANKTVSDSEMERIQDTVVAEIREIRDGAQKILVLLKDPQEADFIKDFTTIVEQLNTHRKSLDDIVKDQMFVHIDYDILGRIRLG